MRKVLIALSVVPLMAGTAMATQMLTDGQMNEVASGSDLPINIGTLNSIFTENLGGVPLDLRRGLGTSTTVIPNQSTDGCGAKAC